VEVDSEELLHALGERAPQDRQQAHRRPVHRSLRRPEVGRPRRGAQRQEIPQVQQEADLPQPEAGERHHRPQIPGDRRRNQDRQYRYIGTLHLELREYLSNRYGTRSSTRVEIDSIAAVLFTYLAQFYICQTTG